MGSVATQPPTGESRVTVKKRKHEDISTDALEVTNLDTHSLGRVFSFLSKCDLVMAAVTCRGFARVKVAEKMPAWFADACSKGYKNIVQHALVSVRYSARVARVCR
jgi:hypothetical protein